MILSAQFVFAQWEKTNWKSDPFTSEVYPSGDTIIIVEEKAFISYDKGISWEPFFKGSEEIQFYSLLISNNNIFLSSENKGLLFSSDFGKNWEERNNGPSENFSPRLYTNGDNLWGTYSGGELGGIYLSTDFGKNWSLKNNGLPNSDKLYINTVAFHNEKIYLGTWNGVYISSDMGENWVLKNKGLSEYSNVSYFVFNKAGSIFIILPDNSEGYNRFFVSNDDGETWTEKNNEIVHRKYLTSYTSLNDTIIVLTDENIYISYDFGDNWLELRKFKDDEWEYSSLKSSGNDLYIIWSGLLFKSTDLGESWVELRPKKFKYGMVNSMAMVKDRLIVASDRYNASLNPPCLYSSTDLGDSWIQSCPENIYDSSVYIYQSNMEVHRDNIFFNTNAGFFKSTDVGESWKRIEPFKYFYASSLSFSGDTLIASKQWGDFINMSPDLGTTWQQLDSIVISNTLRLKSTEYLNNNLFALMEDTDDYSRSDSIFKSSDLGKTWESVNNGLPEKADFYVLYAFKNNLFLSVSLNGGSTLEGIYFSSDFGETWEQRNNGLPLYSVIYNFYGVGNTVFAVVSPLWNSPGGVYTTTDNGLNWLRQSEGIIYLSISNFAHNDEYIFAGTNTGRAGTYGDVIYKAKLSDFGITDVKENNSISDFRIYPNPAEDFITVQTSEGSNVQIFDLLGIELISESIHPMTGSHRMNIKHLPAGVYFIKIGDRVEKFVKI